MAAAGYKRVWKTALTDTSKTQKEAAADLGGLRIEGDAVYRYVQNWHTAALSEGNVVFHTFSDGANAHKRVRDGAAADLGFMAGVVMATASVGADADGSTGDGGFCFIQVSGYNATANIKADETTAIAAGHIPIGVNGQLYAEFSEAMGADALYARGLIILEAVATVTTAAGTATKVWVNCL